MILLILILISTHILEIEDCKNKFFEGQITYEISYKPYEEFAHLTNERLKNYIGSTIILTYKEGNSKKTYYSPDGTLLSERYLDLQQQKSYARTINSDTIMWFNINVNDSKTIFKVLNDTIISGHPCKHIISSTKSSIKPFQGKVFHIESNHFYAKDLKVNPKWFRNYKEGNFNEIIKSAKGISIESLSKGEYWERHEKMTTINWSEINNKDIKFNLNAGEVLKEL